MQISDSEKCIMDVLWKSSPQTAKSIIANLDKSLNWQDKTVKTLINRLLKKEAIGFQKEGREYLYFPLLEEEVYIEQASESFLKRVFNGKVSSFVAAFAKQEKLSNEDIAELKALLGDLDAEDGSKK
ncbi:BlaI/MecI/CopY family transcriptional regulator [Aliikangiella coralliicola]|uniref:BlaI/MecI/CopY family transcriptional regulator n=1 Tax=Aliikangiella coralliicola TaxID=2592383 RepID=A0A545UJ16_9GAMM|nr:BlaI/MecI/CopY family transcriptional regulator [Aliikangiella coralliicola]TQV89423.1 BlaI/MecI/CopY family transcriptional regulator [Aliikangiella coralliicola]